MTSTEIMSPYAQPSTAYYRRGAVFVTGERTWTEQDQIPLGVWRVIDARGVVWQRRVPGLWRRYDDDDQSAFTWRQLVERCGRLTEIVRIDRAPDFAGGGR